MVDLYIQSVMSVRVIKPSVCLSEQEAREAEASPRATEGA
jgi:hypothetical protein